MFKLSYKILTISWDPTLAMDDPKFGDVQARNIKYGDGVQAIHSITYSKKSLGLKNKKLSDNVYVYPTNSSNQIKFLWDAYKIAKGICKKEKIDLVLTQDAFLTGLVGKKIKKKFGCKFLVHYHGDFWHNINWVKENWYNVVFNILQRFVLKKADALRVMSWGQKDKFLKTGWAERRIRVISTPVDLQKYNKPNISTSDKKIVLHVGRDDVVKDYNTLIKTFKLVDEKVSNVEFWQVGAVDELKQAMEENNFPKVKIFGKQNHNKIIDIYHQSSIFVLSSTSESFGKVLVEAGACGKPVVSTATTGAKDIIEESKNGFLVPIGDADKLAEKIIYLLNNPEEAKAMGERGKKLMQERFSDSTAKIIDFWDFIIKEL